MQQLQDDLRSRIDPRVYLKAAWLDAEVPALWPQEAPYAEPAVKRRKQELAVGRHLARDVLGQAGAQPGPLLRREDRTVIWPEGYSGSISHTKDVMVAGAARAGEVPCLGLDVEASIVSLNLVTKLLREDERDILSGLDEAATAFRTTTVFSVKEAFYKAQYPVTQTFLGFMDVRLDIDFADQTVRAVVVREDSPIRGLALEGFWVESGPWIASAITGPVPSIGAPAPLR